MKIKEITFSYFLCFGPEVHIEFPSDFNAMIKGRWQNQEERSNWSGKTSFAEAVKFLKYGECRAEFLKEIPNDNFNEPAVVKGKLETGDGKIISIERTVNGGNSTLKVEGLGDLGNMDKKEVQKRLDAEFGYSYEDFISTAFFNQGDIHQFMESGPQEKMERLNRWMEIQVWDNYLEVSKQKRKTIEDQIKVGRDKLNRLDEVQAEILEIGKQISEMNNSVKTKKSSLDSIEKTSRELRDRLKAHEQDVRMAEERNRLERVVRHALVTKDAEKSRMEALAAEIKVQQVELQKLKSQEKDLSPLNDAIEKADKKMAKEISKQEKAMGDMARIEASLKLFGNKGICPVDKKPCSRIEGNEDEKNKLEVQLKDAEELYAKFAGNILSAGSQIDKLEMERDELQKTLDREEILVGRMENSELKIKSIRADLDRHAENERMLSEMNKTAKKIDKEEYDSLKSVASETDSRMSELKSELDNIISDRGGLIQKEERLEEEISEIQSWKDKLTTLNKEKEILGFCVYMFGRNGIQAAQLSNRMVEIENEANNILDELGSGLALKITTERELGGWEQACLYCDTEYAKGTKAKECSNCGKAREKKKRFELDIKIMNLGKERSFGQESGGAKVLASLALRLSIVKLRQRIIGSEIGILFLDEIYGMLDKVNRNEIYQLLLDYVREKLGFEQIFQISHLDSDSTSSQYEVLIIKKKKFSEVEWIER